MHLVYSPDDGGFYWERFSDWAVSQVFRSKAEAIRARHEESIIWKS
jgi:hypothetical protein